MIGSCVRTTIGHLRRELESSLVGILVWFAEVVNKSPFVSFRCIERPASEDEFLGLGQTKQSWSTLCSTSSGNDAETRFREPDSLDLAV